MNVAIYHSSVLDSSESEISIFIPDRASESGTVSIPDSLRKVSLEIVPDGGELLKVACDCNFRILKVSSKVHILKILDGNIDFNGFQPFQVNWHPSEYATSPDNYSAAGNEFDPLKSLLAPPTQTSARRQLYENHKSFEEGLPMLFLDVSRSILDGHLSARDLSEEKERPPLQSQSIDLLDLSYVSAGQANLVRGPEYKGLSCRSELETSLVAIKPSWNLEDWKTIKSPPYASVLDEKFRVDEKKSIDVAIFFLGNLLLEESKAFSDAFLSDDLSEILESIVATLEGTPVSDNRLILDMSDCSIGAKFWTSLFDTSDGDLSKEDMAELFFFFRSLPDPIAGRIRELAEEAKQTDLHNLKEILSISSGKIWPNEMHESAEIVSSKLGKVAMNSLGEISIESPAPEGSQSSFDAIMRTDMEGVGRMASGVPGEDRIHSAIIGIFTQENNWLGALKYISETINGRSRYRGKARDLCEGFLKNFLLTATNGDIISLSTRSEFMELKNCVSDNMKDKIDEAISESFDLLAPEMELNQASEAHGESAESKQKDDIEPSIETFSDPWLQYRQLIDSSSRLRSRVESGR
ncbi:hypothetical protein [Poseidonocella sp. HB161398]|uniref:hypothetical protein n=1 Tax=Poseidonocella sp. HB161398 TaxID=2320855 RepID=UPI001107D79A|nr:hypothetical protein [Poseidonocella sp. HB161398]